MYTIAPLNIPQLLPEDKTRWYPLVKKQFWPCLDGKDPWGVINTVICALGASYNGRPVGIILATLRKALGNAIILELNVEPDFRHQKIGTELLTLFEAFLIEQKCTVVTYTYQSDLPTTIYLEKILQQLGWDEGKPFSVRCHFLSSKFSPEWVSKDYPLPKGFKIFKWKDLTLKERQQLESDLNKEMIPRSVSPFLRQETIEPSNSLGLKKNGEVIGWMITNRISEDTIQYSSLFIKREYHFLGYAIYLLAASILLQQKGTVENAFLDLNFQQVDHSWIHFVKKRLVPSSSLVERFKRSHHRIGNLYPTDEDEGRDF